MVDRVFLTISYHPCISGWVRFLTPQHSNDRCLTCLGIQHAEEAFVDGSVFFLLGLTISELRNRLRYVKTLPRSSVRPGTRDGSLSVGVRGDFRITVRASPRGVPWPLKRFAAGGVAVGSGLGPLRTGTPVFLYAPSDDQMSIAALSPGMMARVESSTVVPLLRVWTSDFLVGATLVFSTPLQYHFSWKCIRSSQDHGGNLSLPETNL